MAVDPTSNLIYVSDIDNHMTIIDGETNTILMTTPIINRPDSMDVNPSTKTIYVSSRSDDNVAVLTVNKLTT